MVVHCRFFPLIVCQCQARGHRVESEEEKEEGEEGQEEEEKEEGLRDLSKLDSSRSELALSRGEEQEEVTARLRAARKRGGNEFRMAR